MRTRVKVRNRRRILCVFPAYAPSFGTFSHALRLAGARAFMPPQGVLLIANYLPESWPVRFVDENIRRVTPEELAWADAVFVTGMHIQARQIRSINERAHAAGKMTVLGGPSISAAPELYPTFDYLHVGELGDATDELIEHLDASVVLGNAQVQLTTVERLPLVDFPQPAYQLVQFEEYLLGTLQFSSGCPYQCEFCDIPQLYGRQPRLKSPAQLTGELDFILAQPAPPASLYLVDDNFIGNRKAARELLPHLVAWQKHHGYPFSFTCEATLNIAQQPQLLGLMREAGFDAIFVGIETPDLHALQAMQKRQNTSVPMLEAIRTLNGYGFEVVAGIIIGLDSDTAETEAELKNFIDQSQIPMLTVNILQALPKTPLWDRLAGADRLLQDDSLESNVKFLRPHDEVVATWRRCIAHAYDPERLYSRFMHQLRETYPNRLKTAATGRATWSNMKRGLRLLFNIMVRIGMVAGYRRSYWSVVREALRRGRLESALSIGFVSYHLIEFTREALRGAQNASYYSSRSRETARSLQQK